MPGKRKRGGYTRARKKYTCADCDGVIEKGKLYRRRAGSTGKEDVKYCVDCWKERCEHRYVKFVKMLEEKGPMFQREIDREVWQAPNEMVKRARGVGYRVYVLRYLTSQHTKVRQTFRIYYLEEQRFEVLRRLREVGHSPRTFWREVLNGDDEWNRFREQEEIR